MRNIGRKQCPLTQFKPITDLSLFELKIKSKEMEAIKMGIALSQDTEHLRCPQRSERKTLTSSIHQITMTIHSLTVRRKLL